MATMADVARLAGVSTTTVSHVLNRTRVVAPETVETVREAVAATRYRHNLTARSLATRSTKTIGLAMPVVTNHYFAEVVRRIEAKLRLAGFTLLLCDTTDEPDVMLEAIDQLLSRRVDGLILSPLVGDEALHGALADLLEHDEPVAFLDRRSDFEIDQVYSECTDSVAEATSHLIDLGHERIAYLCGDERTVSATDRLTGYRLALQRAGAQPDQDLVLAGQSNTDLAESTVRDRFADPAFATALIVGNNQMLLGALRALRHLGRSVPHDVALICYDDFDWADLATPSVTAISQDYEALAHHVVESVLARVGGALEVPKTIVVPTTLVHRGSCGCLS